MRCKSTHYNGNLVPSRKQTAYKLSVSESDLLGSKRVPRPLRRQDHSCSNRQHHSGCLHKQNYLDCSGVAQHALVLGSNDHVKLDPSVPA